MCDVTRRGFLGTAAAFLSAASEAELMEGAAPSEPDAYRVEEVVPGVHFAKGDTEGRGFCNSGFVVFDDYVLAIDATYPARAWASWPRRRASETWCRAPSWARYGR